MYGITETTVHVTFKEIDAVSVDKKESNIGKPLPFASSYILDQNLNALPFGFSGELYVGGHGVAEVM